MSAETLKAIEDAISAHIQDIRSAKGFEEGDIVTNWIVAVELSRFMDEGVVGYRNEYVASMFSPNGQIGLLQWAMDEIGCVLMDSNEYAERYIEDDEDEE